MRTILILLLVLLTSAIAPSCTDRLDDTTLTEQSASVRWHYANGTIGTFGDLDVAFKLSGLGDAEYTEVKASADANALWVCVNGGGNVPSDAKKQAAHATVEGGGLYPIDNGRVVGALMLPAPLAYPALECPGGQQATLASVAYTNVIARNPDAGDRVVDGGPFSIVFYAP